MGLAPSSRTRHLGDVKKVGLLLLLVLCLALGGVAAELYIEETARTGYEAELTALALHGENPKLVVVATVEVTNTTPADATFEALDGTVSVQGLDQEWTLLEPRPGEALPSGQRVALRIEVRISPIDAVAIALAALAGGGLDVRFDGDLAVKAFGLWPVGVELHDRQTLRPSM